MKYKRGPKKPNHRVEENRMAWTKIDGALRASGEVVSHDQLVAVLRGDNRIKPDMMIAYCVKQGWLEVVK